MADSMTNPAGPWDPGRKPFTLDHVQNGMTNLSGWRGAIDTQNQRLSGELRITGYKLQSANQSADFYSIFGQMTHGIAHAEGNYNPGVNWVSVGYYGTRMSLLIGVQHEDGGAKIWDCGPSSTVGSDTTSFSIGGNLSGGMFGDTPVLNAGVSGSFGASYSAPSVTTACAQVGDTVRWDIKLPGVGYQSPGVPANPREPSYAGFKWYFGVIYVVPKGHGLVLSVKPEIEWEFDYTRGICYDTKRWTESGVFDLDAA